MVLNERDRPQMHELILIIHPRAKTAGKCTPFRGPIMRSANIESQSQHNNRLTPQCPHHPSVSAVHQIDRGEDSPQTGLKETCST